MPKVRVLEVHPCRGRLIPDDEADVDSAGGEAFDDPLSESVPAKPAGPGNPVAKLSQVGGDVRFRSP